jgi:hypothetical protein
MQLKRTRTLSTAELERILGGDDPNDHGDCDPSNCKGCANGEDSIDCTSETVSGGSTTDSQ